jgi:hypothetical protein
VFVARAGLREKLIDAEYEEREDKTSAGDESSSSPPDHRARAIYHHRLGSFGSSARHAAMQAADSHGLQRDRRALVLRGLRSLSQRQPH